MSSARIYKENFKVSVGLQRILGRDLITSEFVAVFELVKNAYDAGAKRVDLYFSASMIVVADNGKGMSLADLRNKWLVVAYSAKRDGTEDPAENSEATTNSREVQANSRRYAGNKGVGRFSCDRLGQKLTLQTKVEEDSTVHEIFIDWEDFERDPHQLFQSVTFNRIERSNFSSFAGIARPMQGTVLEIGGLRDVWDRERIIKLRRALTKLINPFGGLSNFEVFVHAPEFTSSDVRALAKAHDANKHDVVANGLIQNFIFETLSEKTTRIEFEIDKSGKFLDSRLVDRGVLVYELREDNRYPLLTNSRLRVSIFFLNRAAKTTFIARMGMSSAAFGSIFLFLNGFRVFPIGDETDDYFEINRRKQQGFSRFLGTRDVIGRVDLVASPFDEKFRESSSRDQGLVRTDSVLQLVDCVISVGLRRLEAFVTNVSWKDPLDTDREDGTGLLDDQSSVRVSEFLAKIVGKDANAKLKFNESVVRLLNERSSHFQAATDAIRALAGKTGNTQLLEATEEAERRFKELQKKEADARRREDELQRVAEAERIARDEADRRRLLAEEDVRAATEIAARATSNFVEERKRNRFLTSLSTIDKDTVVNLHHQILIYTADLSSLLRRTLGRIEPKSENAPNSAVKLVHDAMLVTQRIESIARFATKANFRLESDCLTEDIMGFILDYLAEVAPMYAGMNIVVDAAKKSSLTVRFSPIDISVLFENLFSNSRKAPATRVSIHIETSRELSLMRIEFCDNGPGFARHFTQLEDLFEPGITTTSGSGLGLFHARQVVAELGGTIHAERRVSGAAFIINIPGKVEE